MNSRLSVRGLAAILAVGLFAVPRTANGQYSPSNATGAYRTFDLYTDRSAALGTNDHVNLSAYPSNLNSTSLMVLRTAGSATDSVALLNSQPYNATGMEVNGTFPSSYAEFTVSPPRLATSLAVSINGYLIFAGFNQFDDFLKPLATLTVTYEDNSTWSTTFNVEQHVRGYFQSNVSCGSTVIFPATVTPYDSLLVPLYASGGYYMDMQEVRLPRTHQRVAKVRVEAVSLDHFCSTFNPHIYAGFRLHAVSLWPRFQITNRAGAVPQLLTQDDPAWGGATYGGYRDDAGVLRSTDSTIAYDGCMLTCLTMMHRFFGMDTTRARPDSLNDFIQRHGGYYPSFGVVVDSAASTTTVGAIVRFLWAVASSPIGTTFNVEAGTDSAAPYPIATVRIINADALMGRAQVVDVQRPTLSMLNRQGTCRGEVPVFRASYDYSNQGWYAHKYSTVDSVEITLADSLPIALQVRGRTHWVVADGMAPAWVASAQAQGTYPVLDPLRSTAARLVEDQYGNTFQGAVAGLRFAQQFPRPDKALAVTTSAATPELALVFSGSGTATITDPVGRSISYSAGTDEYVSQIPDAIALRNYRHGNANDPAGLFGAVDRFEIPNAVSGAYTVVVNGSGSGSYGALVEANNPGVRITDAILRFSTSAGVAKRFNIYFDAAGGAAIGVSPVTAVDPMTDAMDEWLRVSPNPIIDRVTISFRMAAQCPARLDVFDVQGRHVAALLNGVLGVGEHVITWDSRTMRDAGARSGVFFVRLAVRDHFHVNRIVVLH